MDSLNYVGNCNHILGYNQNNLYWIRQTLKSTKMLLIEAFAFFFSFYLLTVDIKNKRHEILYIKKHADDEEKRILFNDFDNAISATFLS